MDEWDARMPGLTTIVHTSTVAIFIRRDKGVRTCSLEFTIPFDGQIQLRRVDAYLMRDK